jgi:hypothetical protein
MKIKFIAKDLDVQACVDKPVQAKSVIPEWFKNTPRSVSGAGTSKVCMPFLDSFTYGYIQTLWCDIEVSNNGQNIEFDSDFDPVEVKAVNPKHVPMFEGYASVELQWNTQWEPVTPNGYSTLYTHPLNQYDLPFMTFSGIIDTDKFNLTGPLRFVLKEGFEGIIKKGTPLYQMIPFKRDSWGIPEYTYDYDMLLDQNTKLDSYNFKNKNGGYKKLFWQNKN